MTNISLKSGVEIEIRDEGEGEPVVFIPSWARDIGDFEYVTTGLVDSGFRCILVNPRQVGGSRGPTHDITLFDWAADVVGVVDALGLESAHIAGHGQGNRVARCVATRWEDKVNRLVLLAAGGMVESPSHVMHSLNQALTGQVSDQIWCDLMRESGFFAINSDPMTWRTGWWHNVMAWQNRAAALCPSSQWWSAGNRVPMLVLHGLEDWAAPIANARLMKKALPERVTLMELENAGHALVPEVPDTIIQAMGRFLGK